MHSQACKGCCLCAIEGRPGEVAEWFKAPVLKTGVGASLPWVRIPPSPPDAERTRMSRAAAISRAEAYFDSGAFKDDLSRRVAIPTESQNRERAPELARYLSTEIAPALEKLGFATRTLTQARAKGPFLYAERIEDASLPTVFGYGH